MSVDTSNLKPGTPVRLKPLEECKGVFGIKPEMERFFGTIVTVHDVGTNKANVRYFEALEDSPDAWGFRWWFSPDWIAEVLPAEDVPTDHTTGA